MGTKANPSAWDCYANAEPDEPMFVLLARDPQAAYLVRQWADGRAVAISRGQRPIEDFSQIDEAHKCANAMEAWRKEHR